MAARSTATKKPAAAKATVVVEEHNVSVPEAAAAIPEVTPEIVRAPVKAKPMFDSHDTVLVRNGFHGKLTYKSRRTGEKFVWNEFGDEQEMELQELRNAKGSDKAFFMNNWFLFDDPEVIDYLGVGVFYKNALNYEEFDTIFELDTEELVAKINVLSPGQKKSVAYRAAQMIENGELDSLNKIKALEEALGVELTER